MDQLYFFFAINLLLIARLRLLFVDNQIEPSEHIKITAIALLPLAFFEINMGWWLLLAFLCMIPFLTFWLEKNENKLNQSRLLILVTHLIFFMIIFSL